MKRSRRRTRNSTGVLLTKIIIMVLCIFSIIGAVVSEAKVIKTRSSNNKLLKEITEVQNTNKKLEEQNASLKSMIVKNETAYKEKLANAKIAYLTFDDGPSNHTSDILKILKDYNVKATFFVNGHEYLKDKYKEMSDGGHVLANHTFSHDYKDIYTSADNFSRDIKKLDSYLTEVTGKEPNHILRYPGGSNNTISHNYGGKEIMTSVISQMNKEGYLYFDWNVDSTDASAYCQDKDRIVQAVLNESAQTKHAIILMHDLDPKITTVQALPEIIEGLKAQGYTFDVLSKNTYAPQFKIVK